ncbi:MAG: restriction endonuclease [Archaeoglobi archaeon]|nr:restriction endonuclease [Candidatus Mnemosynella sp.]
MWQKFERFIEEIFSHHGYETIVHHVFFYRARRYEVDVLAVRDERVFAVDCKFYQNHWYRRSKIRGEAKRHSRRCEALSEKLGKRVIPLLVTLIEEDILMEEGCIIISHEKLNDFLLNAEIYLEELGVIF